MMFLAQLKGETKVELSARVPCDKTCPKLYATLKGGETREYIWQINVDNIIFNITANTGPNKEKVFEMKTGSTVGATTNFGSLPNTVYPGDQKW